MTNARQWLEKRRKQLKLEVDLHVWDLMGDLTPEAARWRQNELRQLEQLLTHMDESDADEHATRRARYPLVVSASVNSREEAFVGPRYRPVYRRNAE